MRSGYLPLPSITASLFPLDADHDRADTAQRQDELLCETYLENAAEVVHVLPAKKVLKAFIPIAPMSIHGGTGLRDEWGVVA